MKTVEGVYMKSMSHEDELKRREHDVDRLRQDLQRALQENEKLRAKTLEEERSRISDSTVWAHTFRMHLRGCNKHACSGYYKCMFSGSPPRFPLLTEAERRTPEQSGNHGWDRQHTNRTQGAHEAVRLDGPRDKGYVSAVPSPAPS
eukprot:scaffold172633_cov33-Tisochrysis_lutea.AAC.5